VSVQQFGYLRLIVSGFHKGVNLISFSLAEVFLFNKQLRLAGQEALNTKHSQPHNHQFSRLHFVLEFAYIYLLREALARKHSIVMGRMMGGLSFLTARSV